MYLPRRFPPKLVINATGFILVPVTKNTGDVSIYCWQHSIRRQGSIKETKKGNYCWKYIHVRLLSFNRFGDSNCVVGVCNLHDLPAGHPCFGKETQRLAKFKYHVRECWYGLVPLIKYLYNNILRTTTVFGEADIMMLLGGSTVHWTFSPNYWFRGQVITLPMAPESE